MTSVVRIHDGERFTTALAREGRTKLHLTVIDDAGVRHLAVPRDEIRQAAPLQRKGKPYPVERAIKIMRRVGRERGITEAAKRELALAAEGLSSG